MKNIAFFLLLISQFYHSQEFINADRPDQSEGVYTMPKGRLQVEVGLTAIRKSILENTTLRYGVGKTTEIRLSTDAQSTKYISIDALVLSAKQKVFTSNNWLPSVTAVGYFTFTPNVSQKWSTDFTMAFEHQILDQLSLDWNIGANQRFKSFIYTAELNYSPLETINIFAEYFLNFGSSEPNHNLDFGLMYIINPNLQIDVAVGQSIFTDDENPFASVGLSYRFKRF